MRQQINPALQQSAQDVPPDPSPGQGGQPNGEPQSADNSPAPEQGHKSGDADSGQSKEPRTPDNVRGELLRKLGETDQQWQQRFARIEGMLQGLSQQREAPQAPAQHQQQQPSRVEDMSSQQLEALRPQVPEDKRPELDRLIQQRKIDEQVAQRVDARLADQSRQQMRIESNKMAYGRWPELRDPGSQLYQITNQVLNERGSGVNNDPRALLDAANEAGMRLGLQPKSRVPVHGDVNVPSGSAPADGGRRTQGMSKDEAAQIAQRLQNALPGGKKFNLERASELHGQYVEHKDLYIK